MSVTLKKDSWKIKDGNGTYRDSAIFSTTLPEDAAAIVAEATSAIDAQQIRATDIVDTATNEIDTIVQRVNDLVDTGTDTTLTQPGAAADAKVAGDKIGELKSAITTYTGNEEIQFSDPALKQYINTGGDTVSWDEPSVAQSRRIKWAVVECKPGDKFTVNGKGGSSYRLWAFADASTPHNILDPRANSSAEVYDNLVITAPANAAYLIINDEKDQKSYKGEIIFQSVKNADKAIDVLNDSFDIIAETGFNLYNPEVQIVEHALSYSDGCAYADERYAVTDYILVPSGTTVKAIGDVDDTWTQSYCCRNYVVYNENKEYVYGYNTAASANTYTNDTEYNQYIRFTLYYNLPDKTVENLMIYYGTSTPSAAEYVPYTKRIKESALPADIIPLPTTVSEIQTTVSEIQRDIYTTKEYFKDEIEETAQTIMSLTTKPCLTFNIITDTHINTGEEDSVRCTYDSIANIKALNRISYSDAVVHLGDTVSQNMRDNYTDDEIYATIRNYVKAYNDINKKAFIANGNHDGSRAQYYRQYEWYSIAGRLNTDYTIKDDGTNYFYVDYPDISTRCVFLATPDNIDNANSRIYGYSNRLLSWLVNTALDCPNNYGVIMFAHIAPFFAWNIDGMENLDDFYGICNAFHNHSAYTGSVQSADFSGKTGTKIVAYFCGHVHGDSVLTAGETVIGQKQGGAEVETTNGMPCPVITIGCGLFAQNAMSNYGAVAPARTDKTVTQDLWDTMVYRPDLHKIYMVRFGAGSDREIDVP